jgi:3-hydroxyisobutyrate dehydrogenase
MARLKPRLGFIGLGLMGSAMAEMLLAAGYELAVWNLEPGPAELLAERGAIPKSSPAALAASCDVVLLCVLDTPAVEAVVFGPEGVASAGQGATVLVDHSTANPEPTRAFAARLKAARRIDWVDAPVSGGPSFAREARLTVMAGGDEAVFKSVRPIFDAYAGNVTLMGPVGAGQATKVINQAVSGVSYVLMAEVLRLAEASGIAAARVPACLAGGHADSTMLHFAYPRMLERQFDPPLSLTRQVLKDLHDVQAEAGRFGLSLPLLDAATSRYEAYVEAGGALADTSSIYRLYAKPEA